ncbi:hypothetical protein J7L48_00165 [bacterium]|nr:hypothetical protein [bacterium]
MKNYDTEKEYSDDELMELLEPNVKIHPKYIFRSKELQNRIVRIPSKKYNIKDASFITIVSFQGTRPPKDGYKIWGIKSKIKNGWYV